MCAAWCGWGSQAERAWGRAQPKSALYDAADDGDLAKCTRLLGAGTHLVNFGGMTALHEAARYGKLEVKSLSRVVALRSVAIPISTC